jgi:hypothetical protein
MRFVVHEVTSAHYKYRPVSSLKAGWHYWETETLLSEGTAKWTGRNTLWIWGLRLLCRPTSCKVCAAHVACISWSSVCSCLKCVVTLTRSGRSLQAKCRFLASLADTSCRDRRNDLSMMTFGHLSQLHNMCYLASACISCFMCGTDTDTLWCSSPVSFPTSS